MVKTKDLHPGMRVRIISRPIEHNWSRHMNPYLSSIMTVREVHSDYVCMEEDKDDSYAASCGQVGWCWFSGMIECIVDYGDTDLTSPDALDIRELLSAI